jgi:tubulin--tyrosine ligase
MTKLAKNLANPKDKEKYLELKEKYYKEFLNKISLSNGSLITFPKSSFVPYKYYIGRGNNSILVRNALKTRFWWSMGDFEEWHEYNFIWT